MMVATNEETRRVGRRISVLLFVVICATFVACSDGYVPSSSDGGDADAGAVADGDGMSQRDMGADAGVDGETSDSGGMNGGDSDVATDADGGSNTCVSEGDGVISRDEVPLEPGLRAPFKVARDVEVDTTGEMMEGMRSWDYSGSYSGDMTESVELLSLDGRWFKADFPDADYAMQLVGDSDELGVFDINEDGLFLQGVVSPEDDAAKTNIEYDPPVAVMKFPLEKGKSWKTETTASGTHATWSPWAPITYEETYRTQVDARGKLQTPYGEFDVLRIRTVLERKASVTNVPLGNIRTFAFVTECFGTVATIQSEQGEDETEFDQAAEIRRLTK